MGPRSRSLASLCVLVAACPAAASFHFMQIEQVIGGVNGDTAVQAIQLRTRAASQCALGPARLWVRDATGANPVLLFDFSTQCSQFFQCLPSCSTNSRILVASANFPAYTDTGLTPNFTLANLIPASYMAGGSLTFEEDDGTVYWRLSWGSYSGPTTGSITNDADGNFGPPFAGVLPSSGVDAVQFQGAANGSSTTNAADYGLTAGAAVFMNKAGATGTVTKPPAPCPWDCQDAPDDFVGIEDLFKLFGHWLVAGPCDFDGNGAGDIVDLFAMFGSWGACP